MAPRPVVDGGAQGSVACSRAAVPSVSDPLRRREHASCMAPPMADHPAEREPPAWEPEPLGLPVEVPRPPERDHDVEDEPDDSDHPAGAIVIELC